MNISYCGFLNVPLGSAAREILTPLETVSGCYIDSDILTGWIAHSSHKYQDYRKTPHPSALQPLNLSFTSS